MSPPRCRFIVTVSGVDITFQGPADDIFFGIVLRGAAMIMFKDVGVAHPWQGRSGFIGIRQDRSARQAGRRNGRKQRR